MTKKFRSHCPLFLVWLLFAASLLPARGFSQITTIRCWQVSCRLPVYNQQEQADTSVTLSRRLYMDGDLLMYEFSGYQYFVFKKDSLSGIEYNDHHPELARAFGVDSLKHALIPYLNQFGLFKKGIGRLVSTVSRASSGQLKETYYDINWGKHPNSDSCYVTYSDRFDFLPREMSLAPALDSLYQKRLCELKMVITPSFDKQTNRMIGRGELICKLEEVSDFNRDTIQSYFSRYRHERTREEKTREGAADARSESPERGLGGIRPIYPGGGNRPSIGMGSWSAGAGILTLFLRTVRADWGKFAYFYRYANEAQRILFPLSFVADPRGRAQLCPGQHR